MGRDRARRRPGPRRPLPFDALTPALVPLPSDGYFIFALVAQVFLLVQMITV